MAAPMKTINRPENASMRGINLSGTTYWEKYRVIKPSSNTLEIWVMVTTSPRKIACHTVPRDPTR